jgi:4-hydroxy-3-polyprenylbenzoate decarboxylase
MIVAGEDQPKLDIHDIPAFFRHWLERVDWSRDLHFQTCTTMDTLDYSGTAVNEGSKVVIAAAGPKRRDLTTQLPYGFTLPDCFEKPRFVLPGILLVQGAAYKNFEVAQEEYRVFSAVLERAAGLENIPLIVLVDDSAFAAAHLNHFLWVTFTRSNPSHDVTGVSNFTEAKHWGCRGPLIMDARLKPHHAPPLVEDPLVAKKIERFAASGKSLHGIF